MNKPFGSGHFGAWIADAQGLPAYEYRCDQHKDPAAKSQTNPDWRMENEHLFQVGNDRITAVASNFGYVQVRQDEGGPKLLNAYIPSDNCYGAGLGYLRDGDDTLSTFYDIDHGEFHRVYGMGYLQKSVENERFAVTQIIRAPFGDDPVLISEVTITNKTGSEQTPAWYEYWGTRQEPLSFRAALVRILFSGKGMDAQAIQGVQPIRRRFARAFESQVQSIAKGHGMLEHKRFKGWKGELRKDRLLWNIIKPVMRAASVTNPTFYCPPLSQVEDTAPPNTFLCALNHKPDAFLRNAAAFFGGNPARPSFDCEEKTDGGDAMIACKNLRLQPGESVRLVYLYGYLPEGFCAEELVRKYGECHQTLAQKDAAAWKKQALTLSVEGEPWVERETLWHSYMLRSARSFDSFFGEHILSQGNAYQYILGLQGAARDPLQHALPFIYSDGNVVREVLRYTLKEVLPSGEVPYGIYGHGALVPSPIVPSDLGLWLLWVAAEYVLAQKDAGFLYETLRPYPHREKKQPPQTILQLLRCALDFFIKQTGTGAHGLARLLQGDWNDNIVHGFVPNKEKSRVSKQGESMLTAAFAAYVLERFAQMLEYAKEPGHDEARSYAASQREAVKRQWNGKWFNRAYLSDKLGWVGETTLWLEPQPWAILCGAAGKHAPALIASIDAAVRNPSPIGAMLMSEPLPEIVFDAGTQTNAGVWPAINGTLVKALTRTDPARAWDEWKKNTLAHHAEIYPRHVSGTWSATDCYNSVFAVNPGNTHYALDPEKARASMNWTDFPVMNLHPHAWPLDNCGDFVVEQFTPEGVVLRPCLPQEDYCFSSQLLEVQKSGKTYSGRYTPKKEGRYLITLKLPEAERGGALKINGAAAGYESTKNGIRFCVDSGENGRWVYAKKEQ